MRPGQACTGILPRRGMALVILLAVLSVISLFMATVTVQILANRRAIDHRSEQHQADWLARAGIERACSRLLTDSANYPGESIQFMPNSQVKIQVQADLKSTDTFLVTSVALYPADSPHGVTRTIARRVHRATNGTRRRLEIYPLEPSAYSPGFEANPNR
jgi:Tfp pilus assembly protein PilX